MCLSVCVCMASEQVEGDHHYSLSRPDDIAILILTSSGWDVL